MSLVSLIKPKGPNGFGNGSTAEEVTSGISLANKTILITGCNSGLGKESMRVLAMRGAKVVGTARTLEKANEACKEVGGANSKGYACELSDPSSVRACVESIKKDKIKLDVIICNAGIMALPKLEKAYGYELQFFTNHIGHFILVTGLLSELTEEGRVVMLSSSAHNMAPKGGIQFDNLNGEKGYSAWPFYGQSKFANLLFAKELARKFAGTKKTAYAVHPGVIQTNLSRHMNSIANILFGMIKPLFLKTITQGAATECYVATNPNVASLSGSYFADCNVAKARKDSEDKELSKKLWEISEKIVAEV
ncbi:MAG: SDR family oxidoreductase [Leptospiraceae bacterium]|nr:SDR family oxidoreductase [Leptospiraceae bacterium]MCP5494709.1 SDR family oxidoreductase [Leptospiraceae bacterium]